MFRSFTCVLAAGVLLAGTGGAATPDEEQDAEKAARELLAVFLDDESKAARDAALRALGENPEITAELVADLLASGELLHPDMEVFRSRGKQGPPAVEWPDRRVRIVPLEDNAPDVYSITLPPEYEAHPEHLFPAMIDLGGGVSAAVAGASGENSTIVVRIHPDAYPEAGAVGTRQMQSLLLSVLADLPCRVRVDMARVFLTGGGRLGNAAWYFLLHYPHLFAGVMPYAGSLETARPFVPNCSSSNVLVVSSGLAHSQMANTEWNRKMLDYLRDADAHAEFRILDRDTPQEAFVHAVRGFVREWHRAIWPARVELVTNDNDHLEAYWVEIEKIKNPGKPVVVRTKDELGRITDTRTLNSKIARVVAEVRGRHAIDVTTENVFALSLYLGPELVDLDEPLTVTVNGEVVHEETPSTSVNLPALRYRGRHDAAFLPVGRVLLLNLK